MARRQRTGEFKEKKVVHTMPAREKEELRFSLVEVDGKTRGDIRYFAEWGDVKGMRATPRGITLDPAKREGFEEGVGKLFDALEEE
mgnify:CR=1 FL=1